MYKEFNRLEKVALNKGYYVNILGDLYHNDKLYNILKNTDGYNVFYIRYNGKPRQVPTHRLQAYQKYGDRIYIVGQEIRHIDGNKNNNNFFNLVIGSRRDNMLDIPEKIRLEKSIYASLKIVKYNTVEEIRKYHNDGHSYRDIMKRFGISSKGTLSYIINKSQNIANIKY